MFMLGTYRFWRAATICAAGVILWNLSASAAVHGQEYFLGPNGEAPTLDLQDAQEQLFAQTGIQASNRYGWHAPWRIRLMTTILTELFPRQEQASLPALRSAIAGISPQGQFAKAFFAADKRAVVLPAARRGDDASIPTPEEQVDFATTFVHEVGHAVVYSRMTPAKLHKFATQFGPWESKREQMVSNFSNPIFFSVNPFLNVPSSFFAKLKNTPSRYALQNIHEWFAECFAYAALEKLALAVDTPLPWDNALRAMNEPSADLKSALHSIVRFP